MNLLFEINHLLFIGYTYVVPIFILIYFVLKLLKKEVCTEMLISLNTAFLIFCFTALFIMVNDLLIQQNLPDKSDSDFDRLKYFGPYSFFVWLRLLIIPTITILLFRNNIKKSISFTIIFYILSQLILSDRLILLITSLYRDYIPSSWSVYYKDILSLELKAILFFVTTGFIIYFIRNNKSIFRPGKV